jgi:RecA/RadA recombinase
MAAKKKIVLQEEDEDTNMLAATGNLEEPKSKLKDNESAFDILDDLIQKQFKDVVDLSKVDGKVKKWYDTGIYSLNYAMSKNLLYGIPAGRITSYTGLSGTGKSLLAAAAMKDPQIDIILLIETEGGGHAKELIEFAGVNPNKVRILKANSFSCYKINKKNSKIEEVADDKFPVNRDTPENLFVEGATRMIKRFVQALEFTPKLKEANILMILDSLGNLASVRELSGGFDMGARAQDIGGFFRTFDIAFEKTNIGFLYTNKLYTSFNVYDPWKETGGVNVEYNPSLSVRFADSSATDDKTDTEITDEKERRKTSLGSSIKTIRATTTKSRFGTEMRNSWFLLDFAVGPVRLSGLFTLLKDFGVITGTKSYSIKGWNNDKSFFKKNFLQLVVQDEDKNIKLFQQLLEKAELDIKQKKKELVVNDLSEVSPEESAGEVDVEDVDSLGSMLMHMEKDEEL